MDFTEKTIQRDIKYSGRIFTVTQDIVELPNGKTSTRDLVFHTGAVAVTERCYSYVNIENH